MGGFISGLIGGGKQKTPPYRDLAKANRYAGDLIDQATLDNINDFTDYIAGSDEAYMPWLEAGHGAIADIQAGISAGAFDAGEFVPPRMSDLTTDPGYQFRMAEGLKALRRQGAAMGTAGSGAHTRAAIKYGQGIASEEYGKQYDRAVQRHMMETGRRGAQFDRLGAVARLGMTGQDTMFGNRLAGITNIGRNRLVGADAKGSGEIGYWNALIDRRNFKNQQQQNKWDRIGGGIDDAIGFGASFL